MPDLVTLERAVISLQTKQAQLFNDLGDAELRHEQAHVDVDWHDEALQVLVKLEDEWRGTFEEGMAGIVTYGAQTIFGDDIKSIRVKRDVKRSTSSMKLVVVSEYEGEEFETDILDFEGGSFVDVVDMELRVLFTVSAPGYRTLLVLDEPFSSVSVEYRSSLCQLLRELGGELGIQFLIATHEPELIDAADRAYLVEKKQGIATLSLLKGRSEEVCNE